MRRLMTLVPLAAAVGLAAVPANAHNAGCVETGSGRVQTVGSNKSGPFVPDQNPHYHEADDVNHGRLDLIPGSGDQYGARYAADQGNSAVKPPGQCQAG